jgi:hypothetical protein
MTLIFVENVRHMAEAGIVHTHYSAGNNNNGAICGIIG